MVKVVTGRKVGYHPLNIGKSGKTEVTGWLPIVVYIVDLAFFPTVPNHMVKKGCFRPGFGNSRSLNGANERIEGAALRRWQNVGRPTIFHAPAVDARVRFSSPTTCAGSTR